MEFTISQQPAQTTIHMSGQFTFSDNQRFKQFIELVQQQSPRFLQLDFSEVNFIDSAGLGMLLLLRDECEQKKIPLSIFGAQGQVQKIFLISKFDQLFSMGKE